MVWFAIAIAFPWFAVEADKRFSDYDDFIEESGSIGTPTKRGAFPNVGAILFDGRHICGTTLVNINHVLTAASCVAFLKSNDLPRVSVYLNTVALKTYNPGAVISKVVKIKSHEEFNKQTQANDIALLTLDTNITTLYPLSLPLDSTEDDYVGKNATILRWGISKTGSASHKIMLQTSASIISNAQCGEKNGFKIADTSLCAYSGSDGITCEKDDSSGGPAIVEGRQVGVMSWGKGCMDFNFPGVYTKITSYLNWIKTNLAVQ